MRSEAAWSYLDPRPFCLYDPKYDAHLAFWNGTAMTRSYALMIYGTIWCNIYYPESQKLSSWEEYQRIYRAGGFDTRDWDTLLEGKSHTEMIPTLTRYISKGNPTFFVKLKENYSAKEALEWFMPSKEKIDNYVNS